MKPVLLLAVAGLTLASPAFADELVVNGDFSADNAGFFSDYRFSAGPPSSAQGQPSYSIGPDAATTANAYGDWGGFGDHTTGTGNMLVADGAVGRAWYQTVALTAGETYAWSFWAHTVQGNSGGGAVLSFRVDGVQIGDAITLPANSNSSWQQLAGTFTAAAGGDAVLSIYDANGAPSFNDFALDDISFASAVPEPASWAMMMLGLGGIGATARQRRAGALPAR